MLLNTLHTMQCQAEARWLRLVSLFSACLPKGWAASLADATQRIVSSVPTKEWQQGGGGGEGGEGWGVIEENPLQFIIHGERIFLSWKTMGLFLNASVSLSAPWQVPIKGQQSSSFWKEWGWGGAGVWGTTPEDLGDNRTMSLTRYTVSVWSPHRLAQALFRTRLIAARKVRIPSFSFFLLWTFNLSHSFFLGLGEKRGSVQISALCRHIHSEGNIFSSSWMLNTESSSEWPLGGGGWGGC